MRQDVVVAECHVAVEANNIAQTGNDEFETPCADALYALECVEWLEIDGFTALNESVCLVEH